MSKRNQLATKIPSRFKRDGIKLTRKQKVEIDNLLLSHVDMVDAIALSAELIKEPQVPCPVSERFAPGIYLREIEMPAGTFVQGKRHRTEHFNTMLTGAIRYVNAHGKCATLRAPQTFISGEGVMKMFVVLETCRWQTIHPNPEEIRDTALLEEKLIDRATTDAVLLASKIQPKPALA